MHLYFAAGEQVSTLLPNSLSWSNLWNTSAPRQTLHLPRLWACLVAPWQPKLLQSKDLCSEFQGGISHNTLLAQFLTLSSSLEAFFSRFSTSAGAQEHQGTRALGIGCAPSSTSAGALTLVRVSSAWTYSKLGRLFYLIFYSNYVYKICIACAIVFSTLRPVPGLLRGKKYSRKCIRDG